MNSTRAVISVLILLATPAIASAFESLYGRVVDVHKFNAHALDDIDYELVPGDIAILDVDQHRFIDALEITVELPDEIADRSDITIAALLYGSLEEERPGLGPLNTRGRRLHFQPIVDEGRARIEVPISRAPHRAPAGFRRVDIPPDADEYPIAVTLLPVGKGLPDELGAQRLSVHIDPVSRGVGEVAIEFVDPNGNEVTLDELTETTVYIDDEELESTVFLSEPGFRQVRLESARYRAKSVTHPVEEGKTGKLVIELAERPATLFLDAPRGTQVFLNNSIVANRLGTHIEVEPGEHEIQFRIGSRTIARSIFVESGETYRLVLDLQIELRHETDESGE